MTDRGHPPFEILVDAAEIRHYGSVSGESRDGGVGSPRGAALTEWADHLSECAMCQERMNEIAEVIASMREGDAGDAPDVWIERAKRRWVPTSFNEPPRGELLAGVVFDSAHQRLTGTRAGSLESRQLLLASNRLEVELSVGAAAGSDPPWNVSGQIFVPEGAEIELGGLSVVLIEGERELERVTTSDRGDFMLVTRPKRSFRLSIVGDGWTLRTAEIEP